MSDKLKRAIFTALVCALGAQASEVFVLEPGETLQARSIGSVPGAVKVRMFNAAGHALVLTRSGDVWVHGENAFGQLGLGHAERVDGWHRVQGLSGVRAIAAGAAHSVALLEDGTVWTWGAGHQGQLGHRVLLTESKPRQVQELKHAVAVAAGGFFTAVRTADGSTWVFGSNWDGVATAHAEKILDAPVRLEAGGPKTEAHRLLELAEKEPWGEVEWGGDLLRSRAAGFTVTRDEATLFSRQAGILDLFAGHTVAWVEAAEPLNAMKSGSGSSTLARASLSAGLDSAGANAQPRSAGGATGKIAAGNNYTLQVDSLGRVWAWGYNAFGQLGDGTKTTRSTPSRTISLPAVVAVDSGGSHSIALASDGGVWAWGSNQYGQVGDGTQADRTVPFHVAGLPVVKGVATSGGTSLALAVNGKLWEWGFATPDGSYPFPQPNWTPKLIDSITDVQAIAAGTYHFLALKTDGTVWAWGSSTAGQLGDGTNQTRALPVQVPGIANAIAISAGGEQSYALLSDGTVRAWGANEKGQLGDGTYSMRTSPVVVSGLSNVAKIGAGHHVGFAQLTSGEVYGWGDDGYGQLGTPVRTTYPLPRSLPVLQNALEVSGGYSHTAALMADGVTTLVSGLKTYGQIGNGQPPFSATPRKVQGLTGVKAVDVGYAHTVVLKEDGTVYAWGSNQYGILGSGSSASSTVPVQVFGLSNVVQIAAQSGNFAVKSDGTVWGWGSAGALCNGGGVANYYAPVPLASLTQIKSIVTRNGRTLALKTNGTVIGCAELSQTYTPAAVPGLSNVTAIAMGALHFMALRSDGTVWTWGYGGFGQLGWGFTIPYDFTPRPVPGLASVVAISASDWGSLALKSDGTVVVWGTNQDGQLGVPAADPVSSPIPVAGLPLGAAVLSGGKVHSVLTGNGRLWSWGGNAWGELGLGHTSNFEPPIQLPIPAAVQSWSTYYSPYGSHSAAVDGAGDVWEWGSDPADQFPDPVNRIAVPPVQTVPIGAPDLALTATHLTPASTTPVILTYTVNLASLGDSQISGSTTIRATLSPAATYLTSSSGSFTCSFAAPQVVCTRSSPIPPGPSMPVLTLSVRLGPAISPGFTTFFEVSNSSDLNSSNNAFSDYVAVPSSSFRSAKVGSYYQGYWVQDLNGNFGWDGPSVDRVTFMSLNRPGEIPVSGDWNGDGRSKTGLYIDGTWLLDYNGNGVYDGPVIDRLFFFGGPGYQPLVGDWNGSGWTKIGVHKDGLWMIDVNGNFGWDGPVVDKQIFFGGVGYEPVLGDWNGSGSTKIGAHQNGTWLLDFNGNLGWDGVNVDKLLFFGGPGYAPVIGDWNGSGTSKIGAHKDGLWLIDHNGTFAWEGVNVDKLIFFGGPGYQPVIGDWDSTGSSKVGGYSNGNWVLDVNGSYTWDPPVDKVIFFGGPGQTPVTGKW